MARFKIWDDKNKVATEQTVDLAKSQVKSSHPTVWTNPDDTKRDGCQVETTDGRRLRLVETHSELLERLAGATMSPAPATAAPRTT